jgi:hypothetical protein
MRIWFNTSDLTQRSSPTTRIASGFSLACQKYFCTVRVITISTVCMVQYNRLTTKLDKFEGRGVGSHIAQEADAIAANGDAGAIGIILFRTHFTYHHGVANFLPFMEQDVMVVNKEAGISARNPFCVERRSFVWGEGPVPMHWHSCLSSLVQDVSQVAL